MGPRVSGAPCRQRLMDLLVWAALACPAFGLFRKPRLEHPPPKHVSIANTSGSYPVPSAQA